MSNRLNIRILNRRRLLVLVPVAAACLSLVSCEEPAPAPKVVPPPVTDTLPVGDGLKILGFSILGSAVVLVIGKALS